MKYGQAAPVTIPSEPIGSIPRPADLIQRIAKNDSEDPSLGPLYEDAIQDAMVRRLLPGCRHAVCARAGHAGGDIALYLGFDVHSRKDYG
jgi:hypothetical protein